LASLQLQLSLRDAAHGNSLSHESDGGMAASETMHLLDLNDLVDPMEDMHKP